MRNPVETGRRENPLLAQRFERVLPIGTCLRGRHYGQRLCVPHQQVEHTAAPTNVAALRRKPLPTESRPHRASHAPSDIFSEWPARSNAAARALPVNPNALAESGQPMIPLRRIRTGPPCSEV